MKSPIQDLLYSERKEFTVFHGLLRLVPGLEARLMTASEEEVVNVADMVGLTLTTCLCLLKYFCTRSRKVQTVPERMTQKV